MDNLLHITLRATNPDRRIDREYVLCLGEDLLGDWTVMIHYGRYGRRGVTKNVAFPTRQEACQYMDIKLGRRLSAHKRIGCDYQLTKLDGVRDILKTISQKETARFFRL
jgi:hypothetical protein